MIVKLETAKLAKSKGFNEECCKFYNAGSGWKLQDDIIFKQDSDDEIIEAPTQEVLRSWLRSSFDIEIETFSVFHLGIKWYRYYIKKGVKVIYNPIQIQVENEELRFRVYEEVIESGLVEALNRV